MHLAEHESPVMSLAPREPVVNWLNECSPSQLDGQICGLEFIATIGNAWMQSLEATLLVPSCVWNIERMAGLMGN